MLYNFYLTHFYIIAIIKKKFDGQLGSLKTPFPEKNQISLLYDANYSNVLKLAHEEFLIRR